ncbi:MAG: hypothetical protein QM708_12485 [Propioniciclava sp.]|uniref:hypothetical protein n=1 Tax=Propioniciclava sp. TaxID=2038686 RepID=UPI0039E43468
MAWRWVSDGVVDAAAAAEAGLGEEFASRGDAEAWLSDYYEDLLDAGITEVTLMDGDRVAHDPMSLLP